MGLYDTIMTKVRGGDPAAAVTAPGAEAVTDDLSMPPLTRQAFELMYGTPVPDTFGETATTTKTVGGKVTRVPKQAIYNYSDIAGGFTPLQGGSRESHGDSAPSSPGLGGKIAKLALSFQGTPYVWGGTTPRGFDCSGFVQYVFRQMGVNLPRVSYQQARSGPRVSIGALKAGDIVAWDNSSRNNGADHVAIFLGSGLIAEAPRPGVALRVRKLGKNEGAWGVRVL